MRVRVWVWVWVRVRIMGAGQGSDVGLGLGLWKVLWGWGTSHRSSEQRAGARRADSLGCTSCSGRERLLHQPFVGRAQAA